MLRLPDVEERVKLYFEEQDKFKEQLKKLVRIKGKVAVIDLREEEIIHAGNRFMIYALYPEAEISMHIAWGFKKQNTAVMIGKSIINKASKTDIGERKPAKKYFDGVEQGKKNTREFVKHLFDLHLDYVPKKNPPTKLQEKAMQKFKDFLEYERNEE